MKLHELQSTAGSRHSKKRIGRGPGSGQGETAGRGENGQNSRSGGGVRPGFEGGQNPLYRRLPKRGFTNARFKKEFAIVNFDILNRFEDGTVVTPELLAEKGYIKDQKDGIKILANGELTKKLTVKATKFSSAAKVAIEEKGGSTEVL